MPGVGSTCVRCSDCGVTPVQATHGVPVCNAGLKRRVTAVTSSTTSSKHAEGMAEGVRVPLSPHFRQQRRAARDSDKKQTCCAA